MCCLYEWLKSSEVCDFRIEILSSKNTKVQSESTFVAHF